MSEPLKCYTPVMKEFDQYDVGAHLHTAPYNWRLKLDMAYDLGVRRFDCAILGYGGCPMAKDELIGNMPYRTIYQLLRNASIIQIV